MTFSSLAFLFIFFPLTFILYALTKSIKVRNIILAAASIVFYAFGEPSAVVLLLLSVACNYILGILVTKGNAKSKKMYVVTAAVINIGMLFGFKYLGFFGSVLGGMTHSELNVPYLRLPIGISFFTFQGLSYVIDVYRNKKLLQRNPFYVLLYISFFPQLIAGPIVRYEDISYQLRHREFNSDRVSRGILRFIFGLGKKVLVANQMGLVADKVFSCNTDSLGTAPAWIGALCYTLQIFFDFSGYSDMAIGLGCIFGFDFKENFNYPFISSSIQEFWRRWHISLSTWFKEYVYIPLGGNRKGKLRTDLNKLFVFFLTGLWHGANFTFIVWGLIHGVCQFLENHDIIPVKKKWFKPFSHIYVLLVTVTAFVVFRADSMAHAAGVLTDMFNIKAGSAAVNNEVFALITPLFIVSFLFAVLLSAPVFRKIEAKMADSDYSEGCMIAEYACSLLIYVLCILSLSSGSYNPFIYFRF